MVREWAESVAFGLEEPGTSGGEKSNGSKRDSGRSKSKGGDSSEPEAAGMRPQDVDGSRALQCVDWLLACDARYRGPGEVGLVAVTGSKPGPGAAGAAATIGEGPAEGGAASSEPGSGAGVSPEGAAEPAAAAAAAQVLEVPVSKVVEQVVQDEDGSSAREIQDALEAEGIRSAAILAALTSEELASVAGLSLGVRKRLHAKAKELAAADSG